MMKLPFLTVLVLASIGLSGCFESRQNKPVAEIPATPLPVAASNENSAVNVNRPPDSSVGPGFVADEKAAIEIAVRAWRPVYGNDIDHQKPYVATLRNGVWTVTGSLPDAKPGTAYVGGVALAEISQTDGRVLRIFHGK